MNRLLLRETQGQADQRNGAKMAHFVLGQVSEGRNDMRAATSKLDSLRRGWVANSLVDMGAFVVAKELLAREGIHVGVYQKLLGNDDSEDRITVLPKKETFISGSGIPTLQLVHEDDRRLIREATLTGQDGAISRVTVLNVKGPAGLGNHYHDTPEHFTVLDGNPTLLTAQKENPDMVTVESFPEGGHRTMEPGEVHTFMFDGPGTLISTQEGAFNPDDLHTQKLEPPQQQ